MSKTPQKINKKTASELYHYADKYIDLKQLFKSGKPKIKELTEYKIKKIKAAVKLSHALAGSKAYFERDFIPVKRTPRLRNYNKETGQPLWLAGISINGGAKINKDLHINKKFELEYKRGEYDALSAPLNATSEKTLIASIEKHRKRIESEDTTNIGAYGMYIKPNFKEGHNPTDIIISKSLHLFEKYNSLAAAGGKRDNGRLAVSMDKWGYSLMWEIKRK